MSITVTSVPGIVGGRGDRLAIYTHLLCTMAPRLSKRQIRELEELAALDKEDDSPVEKESEADKPAPQPKTGAFAAVSVLSENGRKWHMKRFVRILQLMSSGNTEDDESEEE